MTFSPTFLSAALLWWQANVNTSVSLFWTMIQTFAALIFVLALAVVVLRYVLPRLNSMTGADMGMMRIVDRLPVSPSQSLYVIEVAGRWLVVGVSSAGIQMVSELDPVSAEAAEAELDARRAAKPPLGELGQAAREKLGRLLNKEVKK
jgi:flagellar protein FliO/FliZ